MFREMRVRPAAVAGTFYEDDPRALRESVEECLRDAGPPSGPAPKALIVPHAGYVYSGPVAARAYAQLAPLRGRVQRVVLLGPAHRVALRGLAAPRTEAFATPLGVIPIDGPALARLDGLPQVLRSDEPHALEHSLEVQLPFLQVVLGEFALVPLVVGDASAEEVALVLERLWLGDETLLVISSDLSHYLDYESARRIDAETCRAIEELRPDALGRDSACGRVPVRGLLVAARRHGLAARTLDLRSSGDTAGDRRRVVGYGAWAFAPETPAHRGAGNSEARDAEGGDGRLLAIARESIGHGLAHGRALTPPLESLPAALRTDGAAFVTLRSPGGALRGCIGSLEARLPLAFDVAENAFRAAFRDPRFPPLQRRELPGLDVHLSVLSAPEPFPVSSEADLLAQLRPGRDGLVLDDGAHRATFLPDVWEQLPSARDFVRHLKRKAGLREDHWSQALRFQRYTTRGIG
jgi:AmmeMemoRadiSam system protein B/AmmeMemoRadiSam system protein A